MKYAKIIPIAAAVLLLAGCADNPYMGNTQTADAEGGALLGGIAGAVIGNQTGSPLAGAAIGAGLGGLAGAAAGQQQQQAQPQPGFYAPPPNNQPCPAGYTCVPDE
jgi:outer membrane lipoprotein SlyB